MHGFNGFGARGRLVKIPGQFFAELLPQIDNLAELKITLYVMWHAQQIEGRVAYVRQRDILNDDIFMSGLGPRVDARRDAALEGLERATARGTLLHVHLTEDGSENDLYFINSDRGKAAVEGIEAGTWKPDVRSGTAVDLRVERPNVFTLYEQNIGALTPLIADSLQDLEDTYSSEWVEDAIQIAVNNNVRKLKYVEAILARWQEEGRVEREDNLDDSQRFISGKYRDEIEF